ncbi:hypothetical protein F4604DRAFT_1677033 [Suillus subluteus]|nr:hypothetical protein F4604DRAFT_1677033 [Suillus subluteus]
MYKSSQLDHSHALHTIVKHIEYLVVEDLLDKQCTSKDHQPGIDTRQCAKWDIDVDEQKLPTPQVHGQWIYYFSVDNVVFVGDGQVFDLIQEVNFGRLHQSLANNK